MLRGDGAVEEVGSCALRQAQTVPVPVAACVAKVEPHERFGLFSRPLKQVGFGDVGKRFIRLEEPMRAEAPCVHDPLRNALMIEVEDFFAEVLILE